MQGLPGCCDEDIGIGSVRFGWPCRPIVSAALSPHPLVYRPRRADLDGAKATKRHKYPSSDEVDVPLRPL
jgi:hypothetical protein